jgi:hypothetical protein
VIGSTTAGHSLYQNEFFRQGVAGVSETTTQRIFFPFVNLRYDDLGEQTGTAFDLLLLQVLVKTNEITEENLKKPIFVIVMKKLLMYCIVVSYTSTISN